jgi:hypothetical protein
VTEQPRGRENLRFWDLIDLMLLEELLGNDLANVREASADREGRDGLSVVRVVVAVAIVVAVAGVCPGVPGEP